MTPEEAAKVQAAEKEGTELAVVIGKAIADYKKGGLKEAMKDLPDLAKEGKEAFEAGKEVLPVLKDGKSTSEFILCCVVIVGVIVLHGIGKPLPMATEGILGVVSGIYTFSRAIVKKPVT